MNYNILTVIFVKLYYNDYWIVINYILDHSGLTCQNSSPLKGSTEVLLKIVVLLYVFYIVPVYHAA